MYYAILDRDRYPMSLCNACIRLGGNDGTRRASFYYFSISRAALDHRPWRAGTVYLLPADGFEAQPPFTVRGIEIHSPQLANAAPVRPTAKLSVRPEDFPFLRQIRGHDDAALHARAAADPDGFPWHDDG
ncbi:hypothetical protein [Actinopolymorpha alba]|uniref:hypothetical protein n=1 Tax=Actinopolymorpha alba TaxID=533267 RepID=UPI000366A00E|nr:hypothetical protein [Actinopolymorpha alba]